MMYNKRSHIFRKAEFNLKSKKIRIIAITLAALSALAITVAAAYDSSEDPIISLSYLTNIFKPEILEAVDSRIDDKIGNIDLTQNQPIYDEQPVQTSSPVSTTYEVIELKYGDALYAASACDIMLRSGSAYCIAPDASQGIADYTSGTEIYNYEYLTKNHMCLIPRGDGRGIYADSESVYIMVRGEYTIVER